MSKDQKIMAALKRVLCNAGNYPQSFSHMVLGEDLSKVVDNAYEAVMSVIEDDVEYEYNITKEVNGRKPEFVWATWVSESFARDILEGSGDTFKRWNLKLVRRIKPGEVENV